MFGRNINVFGEIINPIGYTLNLSAYTGRIMIFVKDEDDLSDLYAEISSDALIFYFFL